MASAGTGAAAGIGGAGAPGVAGSPSGAPAGPEAGAGGAGGETDGVTAVPLASGFVLPFAVSPTGPEAPAPFGDVGADRGTAGTRATRTGGSAAGDPAAASPATESEEAGAPDPDELTGSSPGAATAAAGTSVAAG
jgi:hypothetical protein